MITRISKSRLETYLIETRKKQGFQSHQWKPTPIIYTERKLNKVIEKIHDNKEKGYQLTHVYTPLSFDEELNNQGVYNTFLAKDYQNFIIDVTEYTDEMLKDLILKCMTATSRRLVLFEYFNEENKDSVMVWLDMLNLGYSYMPTQSVKLNNL